MIIWRGAHLDCWTRQRRPQSTTERSWSFVRLDPTHNTRYHCRTILTPAPWLLRAHNVYRSLRALVLPRRDARRYWRPARGSARRSNPSLLPPFFGVCGLCKGVNSGLLHLRLESWAISRRLYGWPRFRKNLKEFCLFGDDHLNRDYKISRLQAKSLSR